MVSGDTDLAPAIVYIREMWKMNKIFCLFPFKRKNKDLVRLVHGSWILKPQDYIKNQFDDPFVTNDGFRLAKPSTW